VDDWSRYIWVYCLRSKTADEISTKFQEFQVLLETQCSEVHIQRFRSDNGTGEYNNSIFQQLLRERGIIYEPSTPYTQHQNEVSERTIRTITEMARSMLQESTLSEVFWSEAVNTAVYLRNRAPSASHIDDRRCTPYGLYFGSRPSLAHIWPFGCDVWVHVPDEKRTNFESKTKHYVLLGYVVNVTNIWRVWGSEQYRQTIATNCVFDKNSFGRSNEENSQSTVVHSFIPDVSSGMDKAAKAILRPVAPVSPLNVYIASRSDGYSQVECIEPATYKEAVSSKDSMEWQHAIDDKWNSLQENKTRILKDRAEIPGDKRPLRNK